ncbi:alpha/beta fold hydrolase [Paraglaciecola sp. L3A3]|uniref:alpha/beta fold hydrolase n=1 Tax=Paraglaciecola sp. L3A3 TaxID=2686358 RepID=UPI00131AF903|nr:alpha/beta hydrolase [Paraglaciecola sp. L3A3]
MSRFSIGKKLCKAIHVLEAKIANLSKYSVAANNLDIPYLSNVERFTHDKPVLLLLHGFSGDKYVWNRLAKYFKNDYQLLIPDLMGHGDSVYSEHGNYSMPAQCTTLLSVLDNLNVDKFHVVGNSMGGMIAATLIEQIPQRIEKCVLIDPAGAKSDFVIDLAKNKFNPFNYCTEQDFFDFYKTLMAKPPFVPKFILKSVARDYINKNAQHAHMFSQFYNINDFFPASHHFSFTNTMLIWGLNDKLLPIEDYQQWKTMLTGCTRIYEDLGHLPMIEDAKRVSEDILAFLQEPV